MAANDLDQVLPVGPLSPEDLGVPALPPPPVAPQPSQATGKERMLSSLMLALAGAMGPQKGLGIPRGVTSFQQDAQHKRDKVDQVAQQDYQRQQQLYSQASQLVQREQQQRQQTYAQAMQSLRTQARTLGTKAEYDQLLEQVAGMLQGQGYRVTPNTLRRDVPYFDPGAEKRAVSAIEKWRKNPSNAKLMDTNPEAAKAAMVPVDLDGDGVSELKSLNDLATLASMPFAQDASGKTVFSPPETDLEKLTERGQWTSVFTAQAKAEGKNVSDPKVQQWITEQVDQKVTALTTSRRPPKDTPPPGSLPVATQRRVDAKSRGFEQQQVVKTTQKIAEAAAFVQGLDINTQNPNDDQALLYAFAKAMDPDSVVREGEYQTVQKYSQSWADTFGFNTARILSNKPFLSPQARANMKKTILAKYAAARSQYDNVRKSYANQINKITGQADGDDWLTDFGAAFPEANVEPTQPSDPLTPGLRGVLQRP